MQFDKQELFDERGEYCECGCGLYAHDAHHCLIPNLKRFSAYLNDPRNIVLVNHSEHVGLRKFDCPEWRQKFWRRQVQRYGIISMMDFVNGLPDKLRHRLDFITPLAVPSGKG